MDAIINKESVTGVVQKVGVVERVRIGLEMDVMVVLGDQTAIVAFLNQVCASFIINVFLIKLTAFVTKIQKQYSCTLEINF